MLDDEVARSGAAVAVDILRGHAREGETLPEVARRLSDVEVAEVTTLIAADFVDTALQLAVDAAGAAPAEVTPELIAWARQWAHAAAFGVIAGITLGDTLVVPSDA